MAAGEPGLDAAARGRLWVWLREHPAPRFMVVGGLSVAVDVGLLASLHGEAHIQLLLATVLAFTGSMVVNFALNRQWSFPTARLGRTRRQSARFAGLVGGNLLATVVIVGVLTHLGLYYLLAKIIAVAANSAANFFGYRNWVFT